MSLKVGDKIGDYEVVSVLGAGGMGKVYKVRNIISERIEAMKVLLPNLAHEPDLADRFMREIKVLASLQHPNIASLHTASRLGNQLVMIMEYLEGETLADLLKRGRIPLADTIDYMCQVLSALSCAHARGVVHRDIKPSNMMLTPQGTIKLMDFGIARTAEDHKLTVTGTTLGSLYYMSPEQVKCIAIDGRSDLYSVGITLYEIATGARPFQADSSYALMAAQIQEPPRPPIQVDPNIPPALNEVIMLALEKDPAKRFQTAEAFRTALESVKAGLGLGVAAGPPLDAEGTQALPTPLAAPLQAAPAYPPAIAAPTPPRLAARAGSHRGLYMALGAILTIAVIVVAATQLPRWLRTRAAGTAQTDSQTFFPEGNAGTATAVPQQVSPDTSSAQGVQGGSTNTSSALQPALPSEPAAAAHSASRTPSLPLADRAAQGSSAQVQRGRTAAAQRESASPSASPAPSALAFQDSSGASGVQTHPVPDQPAAVQPRPSADMQALEERMTHLVARAGTAKDSVENLRRQQQAQGLNLRTDIGAALSRMDQYMNRADAALSAGDPGAATRNMDLAEREIDKLDKFLGR